MKRNGLIRLDRMKAIEAKLDVVMKKLGNKYMNEQRSYQFKPNLNLPTHYTPALRNNENFSYGGGAQQGHRPGQNYLQGYGPPRF